jgi:hypothetical protein
MIREDANGQIFLSGVKEVQVSNPDELLRYTFFFHTMLKYTYNIFFLTRNFILLLDNYKRVYYIELLLQQI